MMIQKTVSNETHLSLMTRLGLVLAIVLPMLTPFAPQALANHAEGEPALVVLTASWCAKCRDLPDVIGPTLDELANASIRTVMLDVDNPSTTDVASRYGISLNGNDVPQIYYYAGGRTQLLMTASQHQMGHPEESQALLVQKLRPLLGQ